MDTAEMSTLRVAEDITELVGDTPILHLRKTHFTRLLPTFTPSSNTSIPAVASKIAPHWE